MATRDFKCPACGARLKKSDKLLLLSQAHEESEARVFMTAPLQPVICPSCGRSIPADQIIAGAHDVMEAKRTAPPSLWWVIFCPIPGALMGWIATAILIGVPSLLFSFTIPMIVPIGGAALGAIWMFLSNLQWYRKGYTDG